MSIKDLEAASNFAGISSEIDAGAIASAFVQWLAPKAGKNFYSLHICIGYDSPEAEELALGLKKGISMMSAHSSDAGLSVVPALAASVLMPYYEFDAAIMIARRANIDREQILVDEASLLHLKNEQLNEHTGEHAGEHSTGEQLNELAGEHSKESGFGLRFFTADGELATEELELIARIASRIAFIGDYYECEPVNLMDMYAASVRQYIFNSLSSSLTNSLGSGHSKDSGLNKDSRPARRNDLSGLRVAFKASGGPSDFFATDVLEKLGAEVMQVEALECGAGNTELRESADKTADIGIGFNPSATCVTILMADEGLQAEFEAEMLGACNGLLVDAVDLAAIAITKVASVL